MIPVLNVEIARVFQVKQFLIEFWRQVGRGSTGSTLRRTFCWPKRGLLMKAG